MAKITMKFKLKKNSSIRANGLYDLEEIMGECSGHGCGNGGEDIDWLIKKNKKEFDSLDIHEENGYITIRYCRFPEDILDTIELAINSLPKNWLTKLKKVVEKHCVGKL
ncbi:MAG: hypothetical protein JSW11_00985 [Candidatus Heimdallarchaeota archaeon]|nr:MAG: hypothetical protein JSW11_00985 [Candidatus Heimdallarchaeota archaeon]